MRWPGRLHSCLMSFKRLLCSAQDHCFAQSNDAISVSTISKNSVYTMKDDEYWSEELKLHVHVCEKQQRIHEKQHCQDVAHALVPYGIYLLNGEVTSLRGGRGGGGHSYPLLLCLHHGFETASCLSNYSINPHRRLVILSVASSVTRSLQLNGKNVIAVHPGSGPSGQ